MADAVHANHICIEVFGGHHGGHDINKIEGAIGRPYHGYHRRIWAKGAALLHGVANSHGFADGNKRTSLLMLFLLYERSDYGLTTPVDRTWDDLVVDLVTGDLSQSELENILQKNTYKLV